MEAKIFRITTFLKCNLNYLDRTRQVTNDFGRNLKNPKRTLPNTLLTNYTSMRSDREALGLCLRTLERCSSTEGRSECRTSDVIIVTWPVLTFES
jgi:hypothetical protein